MKKKRKNITQKTYEYIDEPVEWMSLSPAERLRESTKLWRLYIALGGSLDPEPDPQSPFYFQEI